MRTSLALLLAVLGFGVSCTSSQPAVVAPAEAESLALTPVPLPSDPDLVTGTLDNGLTYFLLENDRPSDRAELRLMVKAGSILEDEDQQGLAHFVEHMAFNGTTNYPENELIDFLQSTGARFGPDLNAYTSFDETVYMLQVRTDSAELFDKGLGILRDWAGSITFDGEEINKERGVVLSEWRSGLGAQERLRNQTLPVLFANSRYADRLPIGDTTVLKTASYDALKRYYRDWYRPDLMAVAVVGNINAADVERQVQMLFDDLHNPAAPRERTRYPGPHYDSTQVVVAQDAEATYTVVRVNYLLPEATTRTETDYRQNLAASLYNQMLGVRFRERSEDPEAPFSFAGAGRSGLVGNVDAYGAYALAKPGRASEALAGVLFENKRVLQFGFLPAELERAKANVLDATRNAAREADKTPSGQLVSSLVSSFLEGTPFLSAEHRLALTERLLAAVTLAEVNGLSSTYLQDRPRAVVVTGPDAQPLPTAAEVRTALAQADAQEASPYEEQATADVVIPQLRPVEVVKTEIFDTNAITILTLANGVRVAYKQTDIAENEILFAGVSKGGSALWGDERYPTADHVNGIGSAMGLGPYTPTQLSKALAGKRVGVSAFVGEHTEGLRGQATPETLQDLFELVYLHFQGGPYNEDLAQAYLERQQSFLENLPANPQYVFGKAVNRLLYGANDPRHQLPSVEQLAGVDPAAAYAMYRARFANGTDWQFNFVGNFNVDTLTAFAKTYLGNLPSTAPADPAAPVQDTLRTGTLTERFAAGQAPKANVLLGRFGPFVDSELERLRFQVLRDALNEELREKLREDLGGVYGVSVNGNYEVTPEGRYALSISFNAEPARVDELRSAVDEVITRIQQEGPKAKTLSNIRTTLYEGMKTAMSNSNGFWLPVMTRAYTFGRNVDGARAERLQALLEQVSLKDLQQAAQAYWNTAASTQLDVVMEPAG